LIDIFSSFQMNSRYFFRTFRRLFILSSSHIPSIFRNKHLLWTSLGTAAAAIGTTIYKTSPFEPLTRSFILHAKVLEKDLSHKEKELFQAAHDGQLEILQQLIEQEKLDVNLRHPLGWTPLLVAVINNKIDCVRYLLSKGADPNQSDEFTNVHSMAKKLHLRPEQVHTKREGEFCDRLSSRATFNGFTALHYAVLNDNLTIINILIEHGADPLIENEQGHLPSAYSLQQRKEFLFELEKNAKKLHEERIKIDRRRRPLEIRIKEYIVGQNYAISTVCAAIRRKESGWTSDESPLVFLFLGSSGVGKTELAKQIGKYLNGEKNHSRCFIRIDMSEYQEKHEVSKLIGAPPGYESLIKRITRI
jgi:ATP-dependent Clp protease ATP-binding subunit ClpB